MVRARGSITAMSLVGAAAWGCTSHTPRPETPKDEALATPVVAGAPASTPPAPFPPQDRYLPPDRHPYPSLGLGADFGSPAVEGPQEAPEPHDDSEIGLLVEDLAVVMTAGTRSSLYIADAQVSVGAAWAGSEDLETPPDLAGQILHGICRRGGVTWQVGPRDVQLIRKTGSPPPGLCLATRTRLPSPRARLGRRSLARSVADETMLAAWVRDKLDDEMAAVGEIRGTFGGGVDRIVVFEPAKEWNFQSERDPPHGDVALLVASGAPVGLLPFADYDDDPSFISSDLQVHGVFDGDGDGVDEVLWLNMDNAEDGSGPRLQVSYFSGGKHRAHVVLMKSYSRVREFGGRERPTRR